MGSTVRLFIYDSALVVIHKYLGNFYGISVTVLGTRDITVNKNRHNSQFL